MGQPGNGKMHVGANHQLRQVIISFDAPTEWVGLSPEETMGLVRSLLEKAAAVDALARKAKKRG